MSALLQDVLRTQSLHAALPAESLSQRLSSISLARPKDAEASSTTTTTVPVIQRDGTTVVRSPSPSSEEDELINVQSNAASPGSRSRGPSRPGSRPHSPTRIGAASRRPPGPLILSPSKKTLDGGPTRDPLKILPTEISQRIFGLLRISQLAKCARVCKKWNRSQTLNYVWFQHYRKENFHDESLPPGKWSRRESKQNWRISYLDTRKKAAKEEQGYVGAGYYVSSGYSRSGTASYAGSGYQTPREVREERWKTEADETKPSKNDMREMYKELGGRKAKSKCKFQTNASARDRGGWNNEFE